MRRFLLWLCTLSGAVLVTGGVAVAGTVDRSFADRGVLTVGSLKAASAPDYVDVSRSPAAVDAQGRLLVVVPSRGLAVARYTPDGKPDRAFSADGLVVVAGGSVAVAKGLVLDEDGAVVVAGSTPDKTAAIAARVMPDGSQDLAYGDGGLARVPAPDIRALQRDGSSVVIGGTVIVRLDKTGHLDPTLVGSGLLPAPQPSPPSAYNASGSTPVVDLVVLADGRIAYLNRQETDNCHRDCERYTSLVMLDRAGVVQSMQRLLFDYSALSRGTAGAC